MHNDIIPFTNNLHDFDVDLNIVVSFEKLDAQKFRNSNIGRCVYDSWLRPCTETL